MMRLTCVDKSREMNQATAPQQLDRFTFTGRKRRTTNCNTEKSAGNITNLIIGGKENVPGGFSQSSVFLSTCTRLQAHGTRASGGGVVDDGPRMAFTRTEQLGVAFHNSPYL